MALAGRHHRLRCCCYLMVSGATQALLPASRRHAQPPPDQRRQSSLNIGLPNERSARQEAALSSTTTVSTFCAWIAFDALNAVKMDVAPPGYAIIYREGDAFTTLTVHLAAVQQVTRVRLLSVTVQGGCGCAPC